MSDTLNTHLLKLPQDEHGDILYEDMGTNDLYELYDLCIQDDIAPPVDLLAHLQMRGWFGS